MMKSTKLISTIVMIVIMGLLLSSCGGVSNLMGGENKDDKLYEGIIANNLEMINEALEEGADINKIEHIGVSETNSVWLAFKHAMSQRVPEYLINRGADVNIHDKDGTSLLMWQTNCTDVHFCELLIKHGAEVDQENNGYTALEYVLDHSARATATEKNIDSIITILLDHGAKIRPITLKAALTGGRVEITPKYKVKKRILRGLIKAGYKSGLDPALEAAILGDSSKLDQLIKAKKIKSEDERQILFFTAAFGSVETINLLEKNGVDLEASDNTKYTPLIIASYYGNLEMVKHLINKGVSIEARTIDNNGEKSALNFAIENDQYDIAEYLIKKGAEVENGLIDLASANGNMKMIRLLLDNGYTLDKNTIGHAMEAAVENSQKEAMEYFLSKGVEINKEYDNCIPFLLDAPNLDTMNFLIEHGAKVDGNNGEGRLINGASAGGKIDIVEFLIKKGANVNAVSIGKEGENKGEKSDSALMKAIVCGNFDIVKLLVENGADLEYQNEFGDANNETAVMTAAFCGSKHILEYLIKKGANINYQNKKGETALMRAASNGRLDNVKLLINNKADNNLKDNEGHTAIDLARANKRKDVVDFLKNHK